MNYNHDSYFKKQTDDNTRMRISYGKIEKKFNDERELKKIDESRNFSKDLFDKGTIWFDGGLSLEEAPENFRNNRSFINGFNYGKRLSLVKELQESIKRSK